MNGKRNADKRNNRILLVLILILVLSISASVILFIARTKFDRDEDKRASSGQITQKPPLKKKTDAVLSGLLEIADADTDYSNNLLLSGAQVTLRNSDDLKNYEETVTVGVDGQYRFEHLDAGNYILTVSRNGYLEERQELKIEEGQICYNNAVIELIDALWSGTGTAAGKLFYAEGGGGVADAELEIRRGIDQTQGEADAVVKTDAEGNYQTPLLQAGNYCVAYKAGEGTENAVSGTFQIKVLGAKSISGQNATADRKTGMGTMRIELCWGLLPIDMDSHLYCEMENGDFFHVYYWDKAYVSDGKTVADLKRDDYSSYGPEITQIELSNAGLYTFAVFNYTGDAQENITGNKVVVYVFTDYDAAPRYAFHVPASGDGGFWTVFSYDSRTGVMTQIDEIGYEHPVSAKGGNETK